MAACSSDDNEDETPGGEKIAVTESEILGSWEYLESKNIRHILIFNEKDVNSNYIIYREGKEVRNRRFKFSIDGLILYLNGGAIATDIPMNETEIYKKGEKLYFNNMPFAPYIE